MGKLLERLKDRNKWPRKWLWPEMDLLQFDDTEECRRHHDELSLIIRRTMAVVVALCLFFLVTLGAPDSTLISKNAIVKIPVLGAEVSYTGFLLFGPLTLIGVMAYLHVFVGQWQRIVVTPDKSPLPFLFNIRHPGATLLTTLVFYWLTPIVLTVFTYKSLPRPEAPLLTFATGIVLAESAWLQLRRLHRSQSQQGKRSISPLLMAIWLVLVSAIAFSVFSLQQIYMLIEHGSADLLYRPLDVNGANLPESNLRNINFKDADLSYSELSKADLSFSNLSHSKLNGANLKNAILRHADLSDANLSGADLTGAELHYAYLLGTQIDETTKIDEKWRRAWKTVNSVAQEDLSWLDLSFLSLKGIDFSKKKLIGTNLLDTDLSDANFSGADLSLVRISERTQFSGAILTNVRLDGAIGPKAVLKKLLSKTNSAVLHTYTVISSIKNSQNNDKDVACLVSSNDSTHGNPDAKQLDLKPCDEIDKHQHWQVSWLNNKDPWIVIQSVGVKPNRFCIDTDEPHVDGRPAHLWPCDPGIKNQYWEARRAQQGKFQLYNKGADRCLDAGINNRDADKPYTWRCDEGHPNQQWQFE